MKVAEQIEINGPREAIWKVITDIDGATERISAIDELEVLERPADGLVGLKWRESRTMFGKTATEVMWITDCSENEFYRTRAESHGCVYISALEISGDGGTHTLTMSIDGRARSFLAKLLMFPMSIAFKGTMRKALAQDLADIKAAVEGSADGGED